MLYGVRMTKTLVEEAMMYDAPVPTLWVIWVLCRAAKDVRNPLSSTQIVACHRRSAIEKKSETSDVVFVTSMSRPLSIRVVVRGADSCSRG